MAFQALYSDLTYVCVCSTQLPFPCLATKMKSLWSAISAFFFFFVDSTWPEPRWPPPSTTNRSRVSGFNFSHYHLELSFLRSPEYPLPFLFSLWRRKISTVLHCGAQILKCNNLFLLLLGSYSVKGHSHEMALRMYWLSDFYYIVDVIFIYLFCNIYSILDI